MIETLKAFAGPLAIIIASVSATWITWRLGSRQVAIAAAQAQTAEAQRQIAQSQRDIAYDRLKYDLFRMRYEVYQAAKAAIERVINIADRPIGDQELLSLRLKMDEARFFFPLREVAIFNRIDDLITQHEVARAEWERFNDDDATRIRTGDTMGDAITKLSEIRRSLLDLLAPELGFAQLTRTP
jgi:hypothetical protein